MAPADAARLLDVDEPTLRSLVKAGYLRVIEGRIPVADVRAFQARNADGGTGLDLGRGVETASFETLLDALEGRREDLAKRALDAFLRMVPEAADWSDRQRALFAEQAKGRFAAVLAVLRHGVSFEEELRGDLAAAGANAARSGAPLSHMLVGLRITRDLLLTAGLGMVREREGRWDAIYATLVGALPIVIDRLTDAISEGYWRTELIKESDAHARLATLLAGSPFGVYEADMDGVVRFTAGNLPAILGVTTFVGRPLAEVFPVAAGSVSGLLAEPRDDRATVELSIRRGHDAVPVVVDTVVRRKPDGSIAGFGGLVRELDKPASVDLTPIIRHVHELRRAVQALIDAGAFLVEHTADMTPVQVTQAGDSIRHQAERLLLIVDELDTDRQMIQRGQEDQSRGT